MLNTDSDVYLVEQIFYGRKSETKLNSLFYGDICQNQTLSADDNLLERMREEVKVNESLIEKVKVLIVIKIDF